LDATTSKFKGVVHRKDGPFQAQIQHQKRRYYLGCFQTEEDAARAYNAAAQKFFGPFTLLNKI
jgi:RAV-like factor